MDIYQILVTHNREWTAREFLFFVIVFIVVAFCLRQLVKRDKMKGFQAYACLAALTFLAIVYASTVFTRNPQTDYHYYLDLFWSWRAVFRGSREMLKEDILNIVLLLPLGGLLPFVFDKKICWWQGLLCGIVVSLGIEILQLVLKRGLFEFDDIMNNSIGCMLGCIFGNLVAYLLAGKPIWHRDR